LERLAKEQIFRLIGPIHKLEENDVLFK